MTKKDESSLVEPVSEGQWSEWMDAGKDGENCLHDPRITQAHCPGEKTTTVLSRRTGMIRAVCQGCGEVYAEYRVDKGQYRVKVKT